MTDFIDELMAETGLDLNFTVEDRTIVRPSQSTPEEPCDTNNVIGDISVAITPSEETPEEPESFFSDEDVENILSTFNEEELEEEGNEEEDEGMETDEQTAGLALDSLEAIVRTATSTTAAAASTIGTDTQVSTEVQPDIPADADGVDTSANAAQNQQEEPTVEIPLNSPSLLIDETTSRFSGTEWYNEIQKKKIIVAGLGGIGSWLAIQLARMVPQSICMYDDDIVEAANMSGQLYSSADVDNFKVNAMATMIENYTTMRSVLAISEKFTEQTEAGDIMMCGFDSMKARRTFFHSWLSHVLRQPKDKRNECVFIDGRLSIDTLQVYCIKGDDDYNIKKYEFECLFDDSEADETICSLKQTSYLACMIGSVMVNLFTNFVADLLDPIIPYDLPFFTEYDSHSMIFKTEN